MNVTRRILNGDAVVAMTEELGPWYGLAPDVATPAAREFKAAIAKGGRKAMRTRPSVSASTRRRCPLRSTGPSVSRRRASSATNSWKCRSTRPTRVLPASTGRATSAARSASPSKTAASPFPRSVFPPTGAFRSEAPTRECATGRARSWRSRSTCRSRSACGRCNSPATTSITRPRRRTRWRAFAKDSSGPPRWRAQPR